MLQYDHIWKKNHPDVRLLLMAKIYDKVTMSNWRLSEIPWLSSQRIAARSDRDL